MNFQVQTRGISCKNSPPKNVYMILSSKHNYIFANLEFMKIAEAFVQKLKSYRSRDLTNTVP